MSPVPQPDDALAWLAVGRLDVKRLPTIGCTLCRKFVQDPLLDWRKAISNGKGRSTSNVEYRINPKPARVLQIDPVIDDSQIDAAAGN